MTHAKNFILYKVCLPWNSLGSCGFGRLSSASSYSFLLRRMNEPLSESSLTYVSLLYACKNIWKLDWTHSLDCLWWRTACLLAESYSHTSCQDILRQPYLCVCGGGTVQTYLGNYYPALSVCGEPQLPYLYVYLCGITAQPYQWWTAAQPYLPAWGELQAIYLPRDFY